MATKKVIDMIARSTSTLSYDDYLYLTGESPDIDEKMQASVLRDYVLSGVKTSVNSGLAQTSTPYAGANPEYELTLDANNLDIAGGTIGLTDYIVIEAVGSGLTKKMTAANVLAAATGAVTTVTGGTNLTASPTAGAVVVNLDATLTGLTSVTSTDFVGALAGNVTGNVTGNLTGNVTGNVTGDVTGDLTGTASIATALAATLGVTAGGTGLTTVAKGSVLAVNAADTISAVAGVTNGHVLTYDSAADTVGWAAPGHITTIEGTSVLSTSETGTAKFLRIDGDNSSSWQVPPDTNTTYTAGDGLDLTSTTFSTDLMANGGLEITSTELSVAVGISQYDVAQFTTGVVDDDFLRIDGTTVEGRSASEVLSDIGAQAALTFGIADTNAVKIDSATVADNDYAKFTASGLEGRNASETKTDLSLDNVENTALSTWTGSTNITTLGTIASGTWEGAEVGLGYGGTELVGETDGKIVIADGAGAPVHLDVGSSTGITILGTIATGTWNGTAIDGTYIDLEGIEVKSTGETGGTKFLREDGDNSCSWQTVPSGATAGFSVAMAIAL